MTAYSYTEQLLVGLGVASVGVFLGLWLWDR